MEYQTQQIGNATVTVLVDPNASVVPSEPVTSQPTQDQLKAALIVAGMTPEAVEALFTVAAQL